MAEYPHVRLRPFAFIGGPICRGSNGKTLANRFPSLFSPLGGLKYFGPERGETGNSGGPAAILPARQIRSSLKRSESAHESDVHRLDDHAGVLRVRPGHWLRAAAIDSSTSTDFFLSGRSLPAWVTGLAFISANFGAQEVIGMGASGAKYGIATSHFYWVGAIPAMVFVGIFMMPFYYGSRARSVPEYLETPIR